MRVEADVITDLAAELLEDTWLVVVRHQQLVVQGQQLQEPRHPHVHVVLKELGEVLVVEAVEYLGDEYKGPEDDLESVLVPRVLAGQVDGLHEEVGERLREIVQDKLDLLPQLLRLELDRVLLKDGVGSLEDTVDYVEVPGLELGNHVVHQVLPLSREVLLA